MAVGRDDGTDGRLTAGAVLTRGLRDLPDPAVSQAEIDNTGNQCDDAVVDLQQSEALGPQQYRHNLVLNQMHAAADERCSANQRSCLEYLPV